MRVAYIIRVVGMLLFKLESRVENEFCLISYNTEAIGANACKHSAENKEV